MFEQVLPGNTKAILALLEKTKIIRNTYLAGGTALALQLGHRLSYDLDFFTPIEFDEQMLLPEIEKISDFKLEKISWRTILGKFSDVRFSIFYYNYPTLYAPKKFGKINVSDVRDIAGMKIAAIASRGTKRDFVDLYFICKETAPLDKVIRLYERKYKNLTTTAMHIMKSLVYFDDAEPEEMPQMLKEVEWAEIKKYFEKEVKKLAR
ncbi:MAG: nucleotidyl transferase AbiEii/AbiGii toxin family protein [Candidatus Omnitrophica bacterium]|nr:nucleotidyl transferase AbiEii/AbiGii toxin family protein [Candidatus Omnitrophota bacterium]MCG2705564.1 nucleotidyl transferase AbiEii/AbiGii toxin family protein [Candidatus Omnitrophota bacterium]